VQFRVAAERGEHGKSGRPISVPEPSALAVTPDGRTLFAITDRKTVTPISIPTGNPGRRSRSATSRPRRR
jgi:hypothetical protein